MALRGNTPSGQTSFKGIQPNATFRGISLAHRIPFWAPMHPLGLTKGKTQSDDQWPFGGTPLRARPKFSFLPFFLPLPFYLPVRVHKDPLISRSACVVVPNISHCLTYDLRAIFRLESRITSLTVPTHSCTNFGQTIALAWVKTYGPEPSRTFLGIGRGRLLENQKFDTGFQGVK